MTFRMNAIGRTISCDREMRILFISPKTPGDRTCGGGVRSGFVLRALKELGDVTVVDGTLKGVRSRIKWFLLLPFMFSRKLMDRFYLSKQEILKELGLEGKDFDCVVVRYVGPMNTNAAWKIAPCFLDIDDLPSQAVETLRSKTTSWLKRKVLVSLLRVWETRLIKRSTAFWVCNKEQVPLLRKYGACTFLPNVAEKPPAGYRYERVEPLQFLTVGGMSYQPNNEGVDWFIDNVWRELVADHPDATYNVVGGGTPDHLARKWSQVPGVKIWGFVDDLSERYESASMVIAPIFAGAGTCIKVLEAAVHGRKVISSFFGARGLDEEECHALGVVKCQDVDDFMDEIEKYLALPDSEKSERQVDFAREASRRVSYERFAESVKSLVLQGLGKVNG